MPQNTWSRRKFLKVTGVATGSLFFGLPQLAGAATTTILIDPYSGQIPLLFPLPANTYKPVSSNWHDNREGSSQEWSHQNSSSQRAHDGVDIFPVGTKRPVVYSPVNGIVSAVFSQPTNTIGARGSSYKSSSGLQAPPWNYSTATDDVANLPLYGNFVWIYSTEAASSGYYILLCHLKYETTYLTRLVPGASVTNTTPIGVLGDTGNAQGSPQLHIEIHYPRDPATQAVTSYTCSHCSPAKAGVTAVDPANSLFNAKARSTKMR
ncbi:MAG TPA: M23 family metallopeptidase [Chloroflexia bacterium]|nr:M23 family metallopeptidase [Chloroflexia bacterium]